MTPLPEIERSIDAQLVALVARRARSGIIAYGALVLLVVIGTSTFVSSLATAFTWVIGGVAIAAARLAATNALLAAPCARRAWVLFAATTVGASAGWAAFAVWMLLHASSRDQIVVLLPTAGIAAGASTSLAPSRRLATVYLVVLLAPVGVALLLQGDRQGIAVGASVALFLGFLLAQSRRANGELLASLRSTALLATRAVELEAARHAAEASNVVKGQFLANMSHELRTPLTAVLGFTDLLLSVEVPAATRTSHLETIQSSAEHLLGLINDVLDLSRIEAGAMTFERSACNPRRILEEVRSAVQPLAARRGIGLHLVGEDALPEHATTDGTRLRQILFNLVGNAIKFTERGHVSVTASAPRAGPGLESRLRFDVADTGVGIHPERAAALFDPFVQADASTSRKFGGSGLGLSIARRLARGLGGDVTFRSDFGVGSVFTVIIDGGRDGGTAAAAA